MRSTHYRALSRRRHPTGTLSSPLLTLAVESPTGSKRWSTRCEHGGPVAEGCDGGLDTAIRCPVSAGTAAHCVPAADPRKAVHHVAEDAGRDRSRLPRAGAVVAGMRGANRGHDCGLRELEGERFGWAEVDLERPVVPRSAVVVQPAASEVNPVTASCARLQFLSVPRCRNLRLRASHARFFRRTDPVVGDAYR